MRRISRGTPAMLTTDEQERFVRMLDTQPHLADAVETLIGCKLNAMTFGEKVQAVFEYMETGRAAATFAVAARALRDTVHLAQDVRGDVSLADKIAQVEAENALLREKAKAAEDAATKARTELVEFKAEGARAVHSGETASA